jgi:hypothetical protein
MNKRFRIALSYAGEKRDFVAPVANILARRFSQEQVLYDKFHRAEFARSNLATYLPALYLEEADLVVAVICKDYTEKEWTGLEWDAVLSMRKKRRVDEVMLCRFDYVQGEGLLELAGYLDLDKLSPAEAAEVILQRLAFNEKLPLDHYTSGFDFDAAAADAAGIVPVLDWPDEAPELQWPVADHTAARVAFARLITKKSPYRYLPISGSTELGKSHLTKQFLKNALQIEHLRCGRFDFKGSADIETILPSFVQNLGVNIPKASGGVTGPLGEIITELTRDPRPTLLIFDTFEQAGKAEQWIEVVLLGLMRAPWMRVVIVGQKVAPSIDQVWSDFSAPEVVLKQPSAQEWFEYGRRHDPDITLGEVEFVLKKSQGRAGMLAQLLGPGTAGRTS